MEWMYSTHVLIVICLCKLLSVSGYCPCNPASGQEYCKCPPCKKKDYYWRLRPSGYFCDPCTEPCSVTKHLVEIKACGISTNRVCHCAEGYYCPEPQNYSCVFACKPCRPGTFSNKTSLASSCHPHTDCKGRGVITEGTATQDRVCVDATTPRLTNTHARLTTSKSTSGDDATTPRLTNTHAHLTTSKSTSGDDATTPRLTNTHAHLTTSKSTAEDDATTPRLTSTHAHLTASKSTQVLTGAHTHLTTSKSTSGGDSNPPTQVLTGAHTHLTASKSTQALTGARTHLTASKDTPGISSSPSASHTLTTSPGSPNSTVAALKKDRIHRSTPEGSPAAVTDSPSHWLIVLLILLVVSVLVGCFLWLKGKALKKQLKWTRGLPFGKYQGTKKAGYNICAPSFQQAQEQQRGVDMGVDPCVERLIPLNAGSGGPQREADSGAQPHPGQGSTQHVTMNNSGTGESISNTVGSIFIYSPGMVVLGTNASERREEGRQESTERLQASVPQQESRSASSSGSSSSYPDSVGFSTQEEDDDKELSYPIPASGK